MLRGVVVASSLAALSFAWACSSFEADSSAVPAPADAATDPASDAAEGPADATSVGDASVDAPPYVAAVLADNPKAYWRMGRVANGVVIPDESGHGNDLTLRGIGYAVGAPGAFADDPAVHFGGAASAIAKFSAELDFAGSLPTFTLECWARQEIPDASTFEPFQYLFSHLTGYSDDNTENGYIFYVRPDLTTATAEAEVAGNGTGNALPQFGVQALEWTHYVLTVGGGFATLFLNGAQADQRAFSSTIIAAPQVPFFIGSSTREIDKRFFTGTIDEVAVYDHALSPSVIAQHFALRPR